MASCEYDSRCRQSKAIGFRFCPPHLKTPRGLQHGREVIDQGLLFTEADLSAEIERRAKGPDVDYQTSALEKMDFILSEVLQWAADARERLNQIDSDDWRYTDRHGSEQVRTELAVYERAQDRAARLLERVSKMALGDKIISLGRAQMELVIELVQGTLEDVMAGPEEVQAAKKALYRRFQERANLTKRVEHEAATKLEIEN
jgi:hypothetical protein